MRKIFCEFLCLSSALVLIGLFILRSDDFEYGPKYSKEDKEGTELRVKDIRYMLEPKCNPHSRLMVLITSKASNFELRSAQRFAVRNMEGLQQRIFLLALEKVGSNDPIIAESLKYGDILQGDFYEDYHNLSYKHGMGLLWVSSKCGNNDEDGKFVLKMDDDIMVRIDRIRKELSYIFASQEDKRSLAGYVQTGLKPERQPTSKWFTNFPDSVYPDFLSGWTYVATRQVVRAVSDALATEKVPFFWIDDVWITGLIARGHLGFKLKSLNRFFAEYRIYVDKCCFIDISEECAYWIAPSDGDIRAMKAFSEQCDIIQCLNESVVEKEPPEVKSCSEGNCLRVGSSSSSKKMSCLTKFSNPFRPPKSRGVGQVIPI